MYWAVKINHSADFKIMTASLSFRRLLNKTMDFTHGEVSGLVRKPGRGVLAATLALLGFKLSFFLLAVGCPLECAFLSAAVRLLPL